MSENFLIYRVTFKWRRQSGSDRRGLSRIVEPIKEWSIPDIRLLEQICFTEKYKAIQHITNIHNFLSPGTPIFSMGNDSDGTPKQMYFSKIGFDEEKTDYKATIETIDATPLSPLIVLRNETLQVSL